MGKNDKTEIINPVYQCNGCKILTCYSEAPKSLKDSICDCGGTWRLISYKDREQQPLDPRSLVYQCNSCRSINDTYGAPKDFEESACVCGRGVWKLIQYENRKIKS